MDCFVFFSEMKLNNNKILIRRREKKRVKYIYYSEANPYAYSSSRYVNAMKWGPQSNEKMPTVNDRLEDFNKSRKKNGSDWRMAFGVSVCRMAIVYFICINNHSNQLHSNDHLLCLRQTGRTRWSCRPMSLAHHAPIMQLRQNKSIVI